MAHAAVVYSLLLFAGFLLFFVAHLVRVSLPMAPPPAGHIKGAWCAPGLSAASEDKSDKHRMLARATGQPRLKSSSELCFKMLLVIIFNRPDHYANIDFLKKLHGQFFRYIVFYGPGIGPLLEMPGGVRPSLDEGGGNFQQRTVIQAMKDFPDYDGYLWIGDDVWMNTPLLMSTMDPEKIWLYPQNETNWLNKKFRPTKWTHWEKDFGIAAFRRHVKLIPRKFVQRMEYAFGERDMVLRSFSDLVYVPRRFGADFITVANAFPDVNFEIVIPTALHLVSKKEDHQYLSKAVYLWNSERARVSDYWSPDVSLIHPLKLKSFGGVKLRLH